MAVNAEAVIRAIRRIGRSRTRRGLVIAALLALATAAWPQEGHRFQVERYDSGVLTLSLMSESEIEQSFGEDLHSNPLYYLCLLPGPILSVLLLARPGNTWRSNDKNQKSEAKSGSRDNERVISQNRKARHNYQVIDTLECGIALVGSQHVC